MKYYKIQSQEVSHQMRFIFFTYFIMFSCFSHNIFKTMRVKKTLLIIYLLEKLICLSSKESWTLYFFIERKLDNIHFLNKENWTIYIFKTENAGHYIFSVAS